MKPIKPPVETARGQPLRHCAAPSAHSAARPWKLWAPAEESGWQPLAKLETQLGKERERSRDNLRKLMNAVKERGELWWWQRTGSGNPGYESLKQRLAEAQTQIECPRTVLPALPIRRRANRRVR